MKKDKIMTPTQETMRAAMLSRRSLLKSAAALGAVGLAGPLYTRNALSSSGELNLLMWSDEYPGDVIPNFEKASGIKVNQTPFSQNEEQINKLKATGGEGVDQCAAQRNAVVCLERNQQHAQGTGALRLSQAMQIKGFGG